MYSIFRQVARVFFAAASGRIWNAPLQFRCLPYRRGGFYIRPCPFTAVRGIFLEDGHDRAVIGAVDVLLDLVAGQGGVQSLNGGVVLVALLHDKHIGVGLGSLRGCILGGKGVLTNGEASLHRVVAVDNGEINVLHGAGQLCSLNLLNLQVMGVLGDVVDRGGQTGVVTDSDQALGGQQLQSAGLVGGVVGHGDGRAVRPDRCLTAQSGRGPRLPDEYPASR